MKLYIYPHANIHTHDKIPEFVGTTPFCQSGIKKHCQVVNDPDKADFCYMGQISDGNMDDPANPMTEESFTYLRGQESKHILDLEGDWCDDLRYTACGYGRMVAPDWVLKCIKSSAATKKAHWVQPIMARPHLSPLLVYLSQLPECDLEYPESISFGFKGQPDPFGTRIRTAECLQRAGIANEMNFNKSWGGKNGLDSPAVSEYIDIMYRNLLSVCAEGVCSTSIRFYETCFFGRVPVIIGDQAVLEQGDYDTSFIYHVNPRCNDSQLTDQLQKIANAPHSELIEKAKAARQYFLDVVVKYFQDPTAYMIDWMQRKKLYAK